MVAEWPLTAVEFDVLWRDRLRLGEPPYPLEVPSPGTSHEERALIVAAATADLAGRGVLHDGEPPPELADAMTMLATGDELIDGHLVFAEHVRLAATRAGDRAAMALQSGDRVTVRLFDGARLGSTLVELLPQVPPAHGQSVSLSYRALTDALTGLGAGASLWEFEQQLKAAGVRGQDVRWIAGMVGGTGASGAQLGVTRRAGRVGLVSWFATADGGVLMQRHGDSDWITVAPGDPARVVARLEDLTAAR